MKKDLPYVIVLPITNGDRSNQTQQYDYTIISFRFVTHLQLDAFSDTMTDT